MHTGRCSTPFAAGSIDDNERQKKKKKMGKKNKKKNKIKRRQRTALLTRPAGGFCCHRVLLHFCLSTRLGIPCGWGRLRPGKKQRRTPTRNVPGLTYRWPLHYRVNAQSYRPLGPITTRYNSVKTQQAPIQNPVKLGKTQYNSAKLG